MARQQIKAEPGDRYGLLTIIEESSPYVHQGRSRRRYKCKCDCGNESVVMLTNLRSGATTSCGCIKAKRLQQQAAASVTHGMTKTRTHYSWLRMKDRCLNPNATSYHRYGGRGISICDKWMNSFEAFLSDMGECPDGMTIDRIDSNGNYEPGNCRWATAKEQARNRNSNHTVTHDGRTQCVAAWAEELGTQSYVIQDRLRRGYSIEAALTDGDLRSLRREEALK